MRRTAANSCNTCSAALTLFLALSGRLARRLRRALDLVDVLLRRFMPLHLLHGLAANAFGLGGAPLLVERVRELRLRFHHRDGGQLRVERRIEMPLRLVQPRLRLYSRLWIDGRVQRRGAERE